MYVLAAATPESFGTPSLVDETLAAVAPDSIQPGDIVGIGIHTANALRGYEIGRMARDCGAQVVFGGIHATLYPNEAHELGGAHAVVKGDGDVVWAKVLSDCSRQTPQTVYEGRRIEASEFLPARWDLVPRQSYMHRGDDVSEETAALAIESAKSFRTQIVMGIAKRLGSRTRRLVVGRGLTIGQPRASYLEAS